MNRYRILDTLEGRYMHIGYDTRATARRACKSMNGAGYELSTLKSDRYRVVDTLREVPNLSKPEARMEALRTLGTGRTLL
jgi:hypothetical protein